MLCGYVWHISSSPPPCFNCYKYENKIQSHVFVKSIPPHRPPLHPQKFISTQSSFRLGTLTEAESWHPNKFPGIGGFGRLFCVRQTYLEYCDHIFSHLMYHSTPFTPLSPHPHHPCILTTPLQQRTQHHESPCTWRSCWRCTSREHPCQRCCYVRGREGAFRCAQTRGGAEP